MKLKGSTRIVTTTQERVEKEALETVQELRNLADQSRKVELTSSEAYGIAIEIEALLYYLANNESVV